MKQGTMKILFSVLKTKLLKNGEAPILMRITINGQYEETRIHFSNLFFTLKTLITHFKAPMSPWFRLVQADGIDLMNDTSTKSPTIHQSTTGHSFQKSSGRKKGWFTSPE